MIRRIATVAVYVDDQNAALEFWRDQVGFEVRRSESMGNAGVWLEVAPEGADSRLVIYPRSAMDDWAERKPSIVFECDNIQTAYNGMKSNGVQFDGEPRKMPWGTYATFSDPDGNEFLLKGP